MRWLFHVCAVGQNDVARYAPASLAREGFVHASFLQDLEESARLYFPKDAQLEVLQVDPRRLDVRVELTATPRGPMPHIQGPIPRDAIRAKVALGDFASAGFVDRVAGTRFGFVAFEGMTLLDLVGVYDPLSRVRSMGFDASSTSEIIAAHDGPIWSEDGMSLSVPRVRPSLDDLDVLVVPGGHGTRTLAKDAGFMAWLATFPENRLIASVCTGALLLGAAGRLRGRRATTHASAIDELPPYGATPVRERVVDEGQVVTAGGVTSGLDLGLHLVKRLVGEDVAQQIARQMEWGERVVRALTARSTPGTARWTFRRMR
jgi:cyclohexyl-isocyanide hydratase